MKTRKYRKSKSRKLKSRKRNKMSKHRRKRYSNRKTRLYKYNGGGRGYDLYDRFIDRYDRFIDRFILKKSPIQIEIDNLLYAFYDYMDTPVPTEGKTQKTYDRYLRKQQLLDIKMEELIKYLTGIKETYTETDQINIDNAILELEEMDIINSETIENLRKSLNKIFNIKKINAEIKSKTTQAQAPAEATAEAAAEAQTQAPEPRPVVNDTLEAEQREAQR